MSARFGRVLTAMVTPVRRRRRPRPRRRPATLARWLEAHGNDGLVVAGTTGEAPVLTDDEQLSLWAAVTEAVTIPVVAGTGTNDTAPLRPPHRGGVARSAWPASSPSCPYYNRPSQAGSRPTSGPIAAATDLPVMIYDIPIRTGRKIATATLLRLAREVPNSWRSRTRPATRARPPRSSSSAPDGFEVYSGDDAMTLPLLAVGAVGVVGVATHWTGADHQEMFDLWEKGDVDRRPPGQRPPARELRLRDRRRRPEPDPDQGAAARTSGSPVGQARLPMGPAPAGLRGPGPRGARQPASGGARRSPTAPTAWPELTDGCAGPHRLPRRARRDRPQLHGRSSRTARCLLIDCGLMFPDADMHGIDLVLPDFTYLREHADRIVGCVATHGHEDHVGALQLPAARAVVPDLRLGRSRSAWPATASRRPGCSAAPSSSRWPTASAARSAPSTSSSSPSPTRCRTRYAIAVHTPQGVILHSGDFKLDLTPVDGRRTDLARIGAIAADRGHPAAAGRLDQRRGARATRRARRQVGAVLRALFAEQHGRRIITASFASHIHRIQQIADAAIACGPGRRHARAVDEEERAPGPRPRRADASPTPRWSTSRRSTSYPPEKVCVISTGSQGEPMSALALLASRREPLAQGRRARHGDPVQPRHPGQRVQRQPGDRRPAAHRRRGHPLGHRRRPRHRPRPGRRAQDATLDHPPGVLRADPRRVPPHGRPRQARPTPWACRATEHRCCARTATCITLVRRRAGDDGRVPAGYLYVDGIVGDVGQGVLRDRRVLAEEGVVVVVVTVDVERRQGAHRPGDHHPGLGLRARGRGPARRGVRPGGRGGRAGARRTACATSRRSSARSAGRPGSSSASAPVAAR